MRYNRLTPQGRIVMLFDRRIERVHLREYLSDTGMAVFDALEEFEQEVMLAANRRRVAFAMLSSA
jgi:hypothetical protein